MSESRPTTFRFRQTYRLLGGLLLMLALTVAGCGFLGGEDDDGGDKYPEPPGRPDAEVMEIANFEGAPMDAVSVPHETTFS